MRKILKGLAKPFTDTTGMARWMLVAGIVITAIFLILAIFAPLIAPYGFAQASADGVRFPKAGPPSGDHWFGTDRLFFDVLSRTIWGARTAIEVVLLSIVHLRRDRRSARPGVGLLRRLVRPDPAADHGRDCSRSRRSCWRSSSPSS